MDSNTKQSVLWLCLLGIVGSAALFTSSIFPNNPGVTIAAVVGSGMFVLFLAITGELMVENVKLAIHDKKQAENNELMAVVLSKAVYTAIQEEKDKKA